MAEDFVSEDFMAGNPMHVHGHQLRAGVASLLPFPPKLQEAIIASVLEAEPQRATDIWYKDSGTGAIFVLRHGIQWQLNETASSIWEHLGKSVESIVDDLHELSPSTDLEEMRFQVVEFLLNADSQSLIELFPEKVPEAEE